MLGFEDAVVKPLTNRFMQRGLRKYVQLAFDILDDKIRLPENWETFVDGKAELVRNAVLLDASSELSNKQLATKLNLSETDLDDLFTLASTL